MVGLDISDRSIKVAQLSNDRRRKLLASCWQEVPPGAITHGVITDEKLVRQAVTQALHQCAIRPSVNDAVVASIPEAESFLRVLEIPAMANDEVPEAIKWEVAPHIPFGIDDVFVDWQPVVGGSPAPGRLEVLVGVAEKKVVTPLHDVLSSIGLDVAALELESQAIVRALISNELKEKEG